MTISDDTSREPLQEEAKAASSSTKKASKPGKPSGKKQIATTCSLCDDTFMGDGRQTSRCGKEHHRSCSYCGKDFIVAPSAKPQASFCSRACSARARGANKPEKLCLECGSVLPKTLSRTAKFCSPACANVSRKRILAAHAKSCEACGKEFTPTSTTSKYCDGVHYSTCVVCKNTFEVNPRSVPKCCSSACLGRLVNSEEANEKRKRTSLRNWGVEYPFQSTEVKSKIKETFVEKYNATGTLGSPELQAKVRATMQERYQGEWTLQSPVLRAKVEATNLERYGVTNPFLDPEVQKKARATYAEKLARGEISFKKISQVNLEFKKLLEEELKVEVALEKAFGTAYHADFCVNNELLIDVNPTASHNLVLPFLCLTRSCPQPCEHEHKTVKEAYHYQRAMAAKALGQTLLQFYDWDARPYRLSVVSRELNLAQEDILAKDLILKKLPKEVFLELCAHDYYTVGEESSSASSSYLGLFRSESDAVPLAFATFSQDAAGVPVVTFSEKFGVKVLGGSERLFKAYVLAHKPSQVVSYVDFNHSTKPASFLTSMGFREEAPTGPAVVWYRARDGKRVRATSLLLQGPDRLLGTSYGPRESCGLSHGEIMAAEGFLPVATAGNRVFRWQA